MTSTLYVGNLPWNTTPEDINALFGQYGEVVRSRIITDRESGRSRGFGFVEVAEADAERMAMDLNGKEFGGRPLTVNEAKPKQN